MKKMFIYEMYYLIKLNNLIHFEANFLANEVQT